MRNHSKSDTSRRAFLACGAAMAVLPALSPAASLTKVWVQVTGGGHPYPPAFQAMFLDPIFLEMEVIPWDQPVLPWYREQTFGSLFPKADTGGGPSEVLRTEPADFPWEPSGGRPHPGFDVQVLNDQLDWPADARPNIQKAIDEAKGFVLIHNSLGDNQNWPEWYQELTGGLLILSDREGMKKSAITPSVVLDVRPVGKHPIVRNIEPFRLTKEETYRGMWQSPGITPLLQTTNSASDKTIAWIGPNLKARIVCIQPGGSADTFRNPEFRKLVRNAILWSAGRLI